VRIELMTPKTSRPAYSTVVSSEKPADHSRFMAEALAAVRKLIGDGDQGVIDIDISRRDQS
jgi:hypothetical protein